MEMLWILDGFASSSAQSDFVVDMVGLLLLSTCGQPQGDGYLMEES
jgi:hypothetical protein